VPLTIVKATAPLRRTTDPGGYRSGRQSPGKRPRDPRVVLVLPTQSVFATRSPDQYALQFPAKRRSAHGQVSLTHPSLPGPRSGGLKALRFRRFATLLHSRVRGHVDVGDASPRFQ